jgi:hypothetical protein
MTTDLAGLKVVDADRLIAVRNDLAVMLDSVEQHAEGGELVGYAISLPTVFAVLRHLVGELDQLIDVEEWSE